MPANLVPEVRVSLILVGFSLSLGLVCSVYSAVFMGLQRYWLPTLITILNRVLFAAAIVIAVQAGGSLTLLALAAALVNAFTGVLQVLAWRKRASHVPVSLAFLNVAILKNVARFCSFQSIWTFGMLCVTGLDIAIVGHYDYSQTGYYSIATIPTNFMMVILAAALGPLMPAFSALSTKASPERMGKLLVRTTRYGALILFLSGLPLLIYGLPILRLWVGTEYALNSFKYLQVLVLANVVRNLCAPYANMVCGIGQQDAAIVTAISEAAVNVATSLYLANRMGALGVALGTLIGSFVSVLLHFLVTMRYTHASIVISRLRLLFEGLLHPAIVLMPSLMLLFAQRSATLIKPDPLSGVLWGTSTLLIAWFGTLNNTERNHLLSAGNNWRSLLAKS
jgi:O-antigen/teichoic acid export membrane protein